MQFSDEDKIDIITFSSGIEDTWSTDSGLDKADLLKNVRGKSPNGSTALYPAAVESIELLKNENTDKYNLSVILMTDGEGNVGTAESFKSYYRSITREIPIYSIMFGDAKESQLNIIANLTNGKIFDGKEDLVAAFKEVRGYN